MQVMSGLATSGSPAFFFGGAWAVSSAGPPIRSPFLAVGADLSAGETVLHALDAFLGIVGAEQADEAEAFAAVGHRLLGDLGRLLAGVDIGRADIGDAPGLR